MNFKSICALAVILSLLSFLPSVNLKKVKVVFVKQLPGDFSFSKNWSYPLGVELKPDGRAGCADGGFCPPRCYDMLDSNGIVLKDSTYIFYQLLDTTHLFHSLSCEANAYEFAGSDFFYAYRDSGKIFGFSETGIATHSSLEMEYRDGELKVFMVLNSIMPSTGNQVFKAKSGFIKIDQSSFQKDTLKAYFNFQFFNHLDPKNQLWWKGWIISYLLPVKK